mgnify:FL=1
MRVGIFGGTFNPPHKMHLNIALILIKNNYVDKVIFVPTGNKYDRKDLNNELDRFNMVNLMIKDYDNLEVSDYELGNKRRYTYETLNYFKSLYKNDEIYFICGIDNVNDLSTWKNYNYILNNYKILVINRNKEKLNLENENIILANIDTLNISSTFIRENIKDIHLISSLLDKNVLEYIKERNIYERDCWIIN